jgi:hypothetical protein
VSWINVWSFHMPIVVEWSREMASLGSVLLRSGIGKIITLFSALEDRRGN